MKSSISRKYYQFLKSEEVFSVAQKTITEHFIFKYLTKREVSFLRGLRHGQSIEIENLVCCLRKIDKELEDILCKRQ